MELRAPKLPDGYGYMPDGVVGVWKSNDFGDWGLRPLISADERADLMLKLAKTHPDTLLTLCVS